jgi:hypothetical protein
MSRRPVRRTVLVAAAAIAPLLGLASPANAALGSTYLLENCIGGPDVTATVRITNGVPSLRLSQDINIASLKLAATDELGFVMKARSTSPRRDHVSLGDVDPSDTSVAGSDTTFVNKKQKWPAIGSANTNMRAFELGAVRFPHSLQEEEIVVAAWGGCATD